MRCPTCDDVQLVISSREGIEIDHCPQCRGVWLDRGELDKIIDRAAPSVVGAASAPAPPRPEEPRYQEPQYQEQRYEHRYDDRDRYRDEPRFRNEKEYKDYKRKKKRKSFLEDIFDFD